MVNSQARRGSAREPAPPAYPVPVTIDIRAGLAADASAIARVRRDSWFAAYTGIIDRALIDRATAAGGRAVDPPPYRRTLVAVGGTDSAVIGYAAFGPERTVVSALTSVTPAGGYAAARGTPPPAPAPPADITPAGHAGDTGELYALYVAPAWWSAGAGRALMGSVLAALGEARYLRAVLWVLADNVRARRFYERAGFAADGATNVLAGLGGVLEVRYVRDI
jgi:ribosomal protein S18 acetylase RimI-like enzyme